MGQLGINVISVLPPSMLGKTIINVNVGQTVTIYKSMLMASFFPYDQENDFPMGDIRIVGYLDDYRSLLAQSNVSNVTRAIVKNNTTRIYVASNNLTTVVNPNITNAQLVAGNFKVDGVSAGQGTITYQAKAINESTNTQSLEFSQVSGMINVIVTSTTNQPPSNVGNNVINVIHGSFTPITSQAYLVGYTDPENDSAKDVKITAIPAQGKFYYLGQLVTSSMLPLTISVGALNGGALLYHADNTTTVGQTYYQTFGVSDVGSNTFTF